MHRCAQGMEDCTHSFVYVWKPEADSGCVLLLFSTFYFEIGSLTETETRKSLGPTCFTPSAVFELQMQTPVTRCYVGAQDFNSCPYACVASVSSFESFPWPLHFVLHHCSSRNHVCSACVPFLQPSNIFN